MHCSFVIHGLSWMFVGDEFPLAPIAPVLQSAKLTVVSMP
jgi:hypothetical protein